MKDKIEILNDETLTNEEKIENLQILGLDLEDIFDLVMGKF